MKGRRYGIAVEVAEAALWSVAVAGVGDGPRLDCGICMPPCFPLEVPGGCRWQGTPTHAEQWRASVGEQAWAWSGYSGHLPLEQDLLAQKGSGWVVEVATWIWCGREVLLDILVVDSWAPGYASLVGVAVVVQAGMFKANPKCVREQLGANLIRRLSVRGGLLYGLRITLVPAENLPCLLAGCASRRLLFSALLYGLTEVAAEVWRLLRVADGRSQVAICGMWCRGGMPAGLGRGRWTAARMEIIPGIGAQRPVCLADCNHHSEQGDLLADGVANLPEHAHEFDGVWMDVRAPAFSRNAPDVRFA